MKHRIWLAGALALTLGLRGPVQAADETRRLDTGAYSTDQPVLLNGGQAVALPVGRAVAPSAPSPIADLLAAHLAEYQALVQALADVKDVVERQSLGLRAVAMKREHRCSELQALKADALLCHDTAYVARLDEALLTLEPRPAPAATTFVPRDVKTGRALDPAVEGGAK